MKLPHQFIFVFLFSYLSINGQQDLLDLLPYKPAVENSLIYAHVIPEWDASIDRSTYNLDWKPMNGSMFLENYSFGKNMNSTIEFHTRTFNPLSKEFNKQKLLMKPLLLSNYFSTSEEDLYIKFHNEGVPETFKIITKKGTNETKFEQNEKTIKEILREVEGKSQIAIESLNYYQTQDLSHVLVDITYIKTSLEGDNPLRRWITIKNDDLTILYNVLVPRMVNADYVTLEPFGTFRHDVTKLHGKYQKFNHKHTDFSKEHIHITRPGTHVIYAMFSSKLMANNAKAIAQVDMVTGTVSLVAPPKESMKKSPSVFFYANNYNDGNYNYNNLWSLHDNRGIKDYEVFILHSEKDKTYMTVTNHKATIEGLQLVMQNASKDILERAETSLPINHYRIRDVETNKLISEYCLLASTPIITNYNENYIVFQEGTQKHRIVTLRDRFTGKLIHKAKALSMGDPILSETKLGILILDPTYNNIGISFWEYPLNN